MGLHILIVDDETLARQRLRTLLADCTAPTIGSVTEAAHATEAMDRLQHGAVDVVLLDIHMPGMDGISFAQALAALPQPPAKSRPRAFASKMSPSTNRSPNPSAWAPRPRSWCRQSSPTPSPPKPD